MTRVTPIRGRDIVAMLEDALEQARRGDVRAIAFALVRRDNRLEEGWVGDLDSCYVTLYGAINILRDAYFSDVIQSYSDTCDGPTDGGA